MTIYGLSVERQKGLTTSDLHTQLDPFASKQKMVPTEFVCTCSRGHSHWPKNVMNEQAEKGPSMNATILLCKATLGQGQAGIIR